MADYDLIVVGGGSGGVRAARVAAERGLRVALVERSAMGGTCVNRGCVPKKLMVVASSFGRTRVHAADMGWSVGSGSTFSWSSFMSRKDAYLSRLNGLYVARLEKAGVTILSGSGSLLDAGTVSVAGRSYSCGTVLLATGGKPVVPDVAAGGLGLSSDDMFMLKEQPRRVLVVGGGYIALEFACIMRGFGSEVSVLHRNDVLLRGFDREVVDLLLLNMRQDGIDIGTGLTVSAIADGAAGKAVTLSDGSEMVVDAVLFATGRAPAVDALGLDAVGLSVDERGLLPVDADYRTAVDNIYAIGDLVGHKALTPVAICEAERFVGQLCGDSVPPVAYDTVASAVFTEPSIGTVGLSEEEARRLHGDVCVYKSNVVALHNALLDEQHRQRSLVKVVCAGDGKLLGMHIVGHEAAEIIHGFAVAVTAGMNISDLRRTIAVHPTMAEEFVTL